MKAVILAGGAGSRLRPITYEIPKPLVTVKKRAILSHIVDHLIVHGIDNVAVLVSRGHKEDFEVWHARIAKEISVPVTLFYEDTPRGTFGYLCEMKEWIGKEPFLLTNGDALFDFDVRTLREFHDTRRPKTTMALVDVADPRSYGTAEMEGDHITRFAEKSEHPTSHLISAGVYIIDPGVIEEHGLHKEPVMIERDVFPRLAEERALMGVHFANAKFFDCGTLERWEDAIKNW